MKKGFTMIELIFVIVILGILASVAIPRLAGTKADAEISAAVANLRTLVSDAGAYHVVKGSFNPSGAAAKWNEITNVPLENAANTDATKTANLKVGGKDCIGVQLVEKANDTPAYIKFTKNSANGSSGTCKQVLESDPLKPYFSSTVAGVTGLTAGTGAMAIGSSTSIYTATTVAATAPVVAAQVAAQVTAPKPVAAKPTQAAKPTKQNNGKQNNGKQNNTKQKNTKQKNTKQKNTKQKNKR